MCNCMVLRVVVLLLDHMMRGMGFYLELPLQDTGVHSAGIKAIKLYAWEQPYTDRINALRAEELVEIRRTGTHRPHRVALSFGQERWLQTIALLP